MANEVAEKKEHEVQYEVNGKEVKLSPSIVAQFVTKGNTQISKTEAVNFIKLCHGAGLNPFLNEAYLVKFKGKPAQMITSKEAFMKRAEANKHFKGFKAGIIVERNGEMVKLNGALKMNNDKIIGAWSEVYRDDRDVPMYVEVSFEEFSKGQATWKQQPANMIRKVAVVNGLREAFPNSLGALYTEDDKSPQEVRQEVEELEKDETTEQILEGYQPEEPKQIEEQTMSNDEAHKMLKNIEESAKEEPEKVEVIEHDDSTGEQGELFEGATTQPKAD